MKNSIVIKPLVSEKYTDLLEGLGKYTFLVNRNANKIEIKNEVEKIYGVNVEQVNTMNYFGKSKRRFTKTGILSGRTASYKKAIVQVTKGEEIDFFKNI